MRVLSIRQPWAWLILHAGKDVENRSWSTSYRGPLLIHAAQRRPRVEDLEAIEAAYGVTLPRTFDLGGIVGLAQLVDCVETHPSLWFEGPVGWRLEQPRPLPFMPLSGRLGLFSPPPPLRLQIAEQLVSRQVPGALGPVEVPQAGGLVLG